MKLIPGISLCTRGVRLALCALLAMAGFPAPASDDVARPWLNSALPAETRVELLLSQMTVAEKLRMVTGGDAGVYAGRVPAIPRLGIPALTMQDGSGGVRMPGTTALPAPLAMAASWDRGVASLYGTVLGREFHAMGANVALAPMINIVRTGQAGRNFESLGEDPYLASALVAPEVTAMQQNHVIATTKHYALNNQENGRLRDSSRVDMRTFHELYLPAFQAAVQAGTGAVMCAYSRIDAAWACENRETLDILKHELGFSGFVMSDWGATHSTIAAANAGLDMEMPGGADAFFGDPLSRALADGTVSHDRVDDQVRRILRAMFRAELFSDPPPLESTSVAAAGEQDAERVLEESAVLLKNKTHLLPLRPSSLRSIALIGAAMDADLRGGSAWVQGGRRITSIDAIRQAVPGVALRYAWAQAVPFLSPLPTVDSLTLTPPGAPRGVHGVRAEYYANGKLSGVPVRRATEPSVYANWQFGAPQGVSSNEYSVRWSGSWTPPVSGTYTLGVESRGGARLFFQGKLMADSWKAQYSVKPVTFTRAFTAGHAYSFVVEAHGNTDSFQLCRILWKAPAQAPRLDIEHAAALAKSSDVAIVFAGEFRTEQYDRSTIALSGMQEEMLRAVARANPRTIVVLYNGGPVAAGAWAGNVSSILDLWYPGQANGPALAALLFGKVNPSGKLPVTYPASPEQTAARVTWEAEPYSGPARDVQYDEALNVGYRWYDAHDIRPLFPFGFGLSYTTFRYANLVVSPEDSTGDVHVSFDVTNTGEVTGSEVPQLYLGYPKEATEPVHVLRGFDKISLGPREARHLTFALHAHDFDIWDIATGKWKHIPGKYEVAVGSSSEDLLLRTSVGVN